MDHKVWKFLKKDRYTEEGIKHVEEIYDFILEIRCPLLDGEYRICRYYNKGVRLGAN